MPENSIHLFLNQRGITPNNITLNMLKLFRAEQFAENKCNSVCATVSEDNVIKYGFDFDT